jgi:hypothetical protein
MPIPVYIERASREFRAEFFDYTRNIPQVPITAHYKLRCETTHKTLIDWTQVTPIVVTQPSPDGEPLLLSVTAIVEIPSAMMGIQDEANRRELKTFAVVANLNLDNEHQDDPFQFYIKNLPSR